jgi:tripartite-type tricarboxylate transporter receptor subunit TctC
MKLKSYLVSMALALSSAHAAYPDKPIRLVVPFAPGGNIDITARIVAPALSEHLGQPVLVDNRGGAGGRIGTEMVAKAPPDGYTLVLGSSGALTMNPVFSPLKSFDPVRDFAPTSLVSIVPLILVVHPSLPVKTTREFIALLKSRPGQVMMASAGTGSTTHLTGELFQVITGTTLTHVPFRGSGPATIELIGGHTQCMFDQVSTSGPYVKAGKLRPIAVAALKRSPAFPEVSTMDEGGLRGFEASTYTGIFLPSATPKDVIQKVYGGVIKAVELPATRDAFTKLGSEVMKSTPEELSSRIRSDLEKWKKVQQKTGIVID